jgi:hypothetical protein
MSDPAERLQQFIISQRARQDQEAAGREAWCKKVPELAKHAEALAVAVNGAASAAMMFVEKRKDQILVAFGLRQKKLVAGAEVAALAQLPLEKGACATFFFNGDECQVVGHRHPYHLEAKRVTFDRYVDLGDPETLTEEAFGIAVIDFIEWASVGEGRGSGKIRFS